jgi:DNA (cytosine-5)-methyltransferase 1
MKHIGLFEGVGGFSLAARWMGWETIAWCEWNEYCQKILKQHFKEAQGHGDITQTDFTIYRGQCDIVTGGFPCQPYSLAGKRKGKEDERHLWPEMLRAIQEIQPRWVIGENVPGLLNWNNGMVLNEIKTDLENEGFEVLPPVILPACSINAPHKRDRVWIIAHSNNAGANNGSGTNREWQKENEGRQGQPQFEYRTDGSNGVDTNTDNKGLQRSKEFGGIREIGQNGNKQFAGCVPPTWEKFPTQPPICGGDDGFPNRVDRIKALGNAIVPQVAYQLYRVIKLMEAEIYNVKPPNDMQCGVGKNNI